jgi:hypothetical protein
MKFLSFMLFAFSLMSTTAAFSLEKAKICECKDCKCTGQVHCGCYSGTKECTCNAHESCCSDGRCSKL